jgi:nicotinamidase-related amidase
LLRQQSINDQQHVYHLKNETMNDNFSHSLDADKSVLLLIDYQRGMFYGVESGDSTLLKNNVIGLAKGAKILDVPTILTSIGEKSNGVFFTEITDLHPGKRVIARNLPCFDALLEPEVENEIKALNRQQVVISGLQRSMCFAHTALHALRNGYDVFGVIDTAGGESKDSHNTAVQRMIQAGVVPLTWEQTVAEWMKAWPNPKAGQLSKEVYSVHNGYMSMH